MISKGHGTSAFIHGWFERRAFFRARAGLWVYVLTVGVLRVLTWTSTGRTWSSGRTRAAAPRRAQPRLRARPYSEYSQWGCTLGLLQVLNHPGRLRVLSRSGTPSTHGRSVRRREGVPESAGESGAAALTTCWKQTHKHANTQANRKCGSVRGVQMCGRG